MKILIKPFPCLPCIFFLFSMDFWEGALLQKWYLDLLMEKVKAFVFKQRRLASLIWLWGVLGTVIIAFTIDFLANSFVISPYYGEVFWLIPIYYFFTLFLSYQAYISRPLFKSIIQFIGQMAIFIIIFSFLGFYDTFMTVEWNWKYIKWGWIG